MKPNKFISILFLISFNENKKNILDVIQLNIILNGLV